jgi:serine/threonine-protein kinase
MMVGDVLAGRYELEELVGTGGMSSVYRAHDRELDRRVALKILHLRFADDDEYVERFLREARTVAGLSHPNIVTVIDRGAHEGQKFIVFEYVEGETLKGLIQRDGPLPLDRALELAIQIARGLSSAHGSGLVHRDVKPQNVLLNGNGQAKVTDFGIAREIDVQHGVTQTGTVLGTSDYISPEQAQGNRVDEQSDIYSLGVVLYELLTGEVPFTGENFVAVAMRHVNDPPPNVLDRRPDTPPRVAAAVARCLAKDPRDRWPSMSELCRELEACLAEARGGQHEEGTAILPLPHEPVRAPVSPRTVGAARSIPWLGLAILAGAILLAVVLAVVLTGGGHGEPGAGAVTNPIGLSGVGAYDPPPGDGQEHNADAPKATDGNEATFWETSHYRYPDGGLGKPGVGLVLDAGKTVTLQHMVVTTDTPGFHAKILAGDSSGGPFRDVSGSQTVGTSTTFDLSSAKARYFVVWITNLGSGSEQAHVNEVKAS